MDVEKIGEGMTPEELSRIQREEAKEKRRIRWRLYCTKVDLCAMGKTQQNSKVYEVCISKRGAGEVQDTFGELKVNGTRVMTCSFSGSAYHLKRMMTAAAQALVEYKAMRSRAKRRRDAKKAREEGAADGE